jgi:hypothetical protein
MSCQLVHVFYTTQYVIELVTSHYATQLSMQGEVPNFLCRNFSYWFMRNRDAGFHVLKH